MKFTHTAAIPFAADKIDLGEWLFTMSNEDYKLASRQHRGLGTFVEKGARGIISVESIGGVLVVQQYREVEVRRGYVQLLSQRSTAYVMHVVPVAMSVRWTTWVMPETRDTSAFSCMIEATVPAWLRAMTWATGLPWFLWRHTVEETAGFAADITRKLRGHRERRQLKRGAR